MRIYLINACDEIDASVFSGDVLWNEEERAELKQYIERWDRAIKEHEEHGPLLTTVEVNQCHILSGEVACQACGEVWENHRQRCDGSA